MITAAPVAEAELQQDSGNVRLDGVLVDERGTPAMLASRTPKFVTKSETRQLFKGTLARRAAI
jgi:hypothetical protein